jgi:predicted TIM-barrel fold metal-dependent hydrolase
MSKIIDVHVHIGNDGYREYSPERAIELMDKMEIDMAVLSPMPGYVLPNGVKSSAEQNDAVVAAMNKYPSRFVRGLGVVDSRHGKAAVPEVDRIFGELGLHGLLFSNDYTGFTFDNPNTVEFLEHAASHPDAVVFAYISQFSVLQAPFMLEKMARKFPGITFINGSSMKDTVQSNGSRFMSAIMPNIYMDIANIHQIMTPIESAIAEAGVGKILFGSGIPTCDFSPEKMMVEAAEISQAEKNAIYFENAARIFKIK